MSERLNPGAWKGGVPVVGDQEKNGGDSVGIMGVFQLSSAGRDLHRSIDPDHDCLSSSLPICHPATFTEAQLAFSGGTPTYKIAKPPGGQSNPPEAGDLP